MQGNWLTQRYCVNDYIVLSRIGKGAHGEVHLCKHKKSNELYAVKIMHRSRKDTGYGTQREVEIMKQLRHPNVLRLYEVIDDPKGNVPSFIRHDASLSVLQNTFCSCIYHLHVRMH